ncbi:hypothetical protein P4O66_014584 [Electrophorus voltai]|uniref:Protein FAM151A n=1 Tax=Electrophorus voltai TaxID=2609070 RepID=A0AAD8Z1K6_9TELE|nr:hypothetical protein P4O66_014584 [Electrophorus voltai]
MVSVTQVMNTKKSATCQKDACISDVALLVVSSAAPNSIKALILTDGLIETVDSAVLCGLSNMSVLVLSNNVIFTIMDNAFQNLTVLRTLLMDHNRITSQSLDRSTFSCLSKLEILQLGNNALRVIDGSWFQNSKALKALFLEGNLLTSLNSTSFGSSDLRNLETLGLSDNLITYVGQDSFHNLPRLRSLDLSRNRLQNAPNAFSYLSWLSLLNLDLNRWNCTCELRELASFLNSYIQSPSKVLYNGQRMICERSDNPAIWTVLELTEANCAPANSNISVQVVAKGSSTPQHYIRDVAITAACSFLGGVGIMLGVLALVYRKLNKRITCWQVKTATEGQAAQATAQWDYSEDKEALSMCYALHNSNYKDHQPWNKDVSYDIPVNNQFICRNCCSANLETGYQESRWRRKTLLQRSNQMGIQHNRKDDWSSHAKSDQLKDTASLSRIKDVQRFTEKDDSNTYHFQTQENDPQHGVSQDLPTMRIQHLMDQEKEKREENRKDEEEGEGKNLKTVLGIFTKKQFTMLCVGVSLVVLLLIITVTSFVVTLNSDTGSSETLVLFPTDGDMLEFLLQNGEIKEKDGLSATWYHSANSKAEMNKALQSGAMILEADVNIQGHNTLNETNIPIMAHPPDIYSDNTLEEWLDTVLKSKKGIKLDFKSLQALEPSLDLLRKKNETGINRPVWLNADILHGPNVPNFWPVINATRFFGLIQTKFPDVTISPGWTVLYLPFYPNATYTQAMVEKMYDHVRHLPQKITFPVLAVMVKNGWPHLSWLLKQSSRFSLTLWQGSENPTVNDLLFIRDNSNPQRIYYDIYEPVLSQFKEAASKYHQNLFYHKPFLLFITKPAFQHCSEQKDRPRRFYPGGDIVDYFKPANNNGLNIQWETVTDRNSLLSILKDSPGGMLVIPVISGIDKPKFPVVEDSDPELPLQDCLELILASKNPWGIYLRVKSQTQLAVSLQLLQQAYDMGLLYHPTWLNMDIAHGIFNFQGYMTGQEFLRTINQIFPHVTVAPSWPQEALDQGYTLQLVKDMIKLFQGTWQDVSLQLQAVYLERSETRFKSLLQNQPRFSLTVEHRTGKEGLSGGNHSVTSLHKGYRELTFYNMANSYKNNFGSTDYAFN